MRLLLVSASCRAIAESAIAAGFSVSVCDQFADWDLRQEVVRRVSTKDSLRKIGCFSEIFSNWDHRECEAAIIAGGFENRVELVAELESKIRLLGPNSTQLNWLQASRSLARIAEVVLHAGGRFPETRLQRPGTDSHGIWLKKSLRRSGGRQVGYLNSGNPCESDHNPELYFQKFVAGRSLSGVFIAGKIAPQAKGHSPMIGSQLIGCSTQLIGNPMLGAGPFAYCGSIGPLTLDTARRSVIENIGAALSNEFGITGIFGIDFIVDENDVWPVDINPRIPASAEIFEIFYRPRGKGRGLSIVKLHVDACLESDLSQPGLEFDPMLDSRIDLCQQVIGKAILFCQSAGEILIDQAVFQRLVDIYQNKDKEVDKKKRPIQWIADIPNLGTRIKFGEPILSLYSSGESESSVYQSLMKFARELRTVVELNPRDV